MNNINAPLKTLGFAIAILLPSTQITHASNDLPKLKPTGISLDIYSQEIDLKVTDIEASIPGMSTEAVAALKSQVSTKNTIDVYGLGLDYQVTPSLNIFGSLGKARQKTDVSFSDANPILSDLSLDDKGIVYTVGGTYHKRFNSIFASVSLLHNRIDLDDNPHDIKVTSIAPAIGVKTPIGILSGSVLYQEIDAKFSGEITIPGLGSIPAEVSAVNKDGAQLLAGLHTQLARDLYLSANVNLNKNERFQVQVNKRF